MRDINQILYEVYNARRTHTYATICPKLFKDADGNDDNGSIYTEESKSNSESQTSLVTDYTSITWNDTDHVGESILMFLITKIIILLINFDIIYRLVQ